MYGLIGHNIRHSLSPGLFSAAYDGALEYDLIDVPTFEQGLRRFLSDDYKAVNITAPFKGEVLAAADECSYRAGQIGAANVLLKRLDGTIYADNFDYDGVFNALGAVGAGTGKAVVIGAGGAGRAAFFAAKDLCGRVVVCNRSAKEGTLPLEALEEELRDASCVVYALPCEVPQIKYLHSLSEDVLVLEAGYAHRFIDAASLKARYIPGEYWLFWQAVAAYGVMTGKPPNIEKMRNYLKL